MTFIPSVLRCATLGAALLLPFVAATNAPAQETTTDSATGEALGGAAAGANGAQTDADATPISEHAKRGVAAADAEQLEKAITHFQAAIAQLQQRVGARMTQKVPQPLDGWEAVGKPQVRTSNTSSGKVTSASTTVMQNFRRKADGATFRFNYSNAPQFAALARQIKAFRNNKMILEGMNKDPNRTVEIFDDSGWLAMIDHRRKRVTISAFREAYVFQLRLNVDEYDTMKSWWKVIDKK